MICPGKFIYIYIYIYIYICIYRGPVVYTYIYIHMLIHIHMHIQRTSYIYIHINIYTYAYTYTYTCTEDQLLASMEQLEQQEAQSDPLARRHLQRKKRAAEKARVDKMRQEVSGTLHLCY